MNTNTNYTPQPASAMRPDCAPPIGSPTGWRTNAPANDGDYYYTGPTPCGKLVVAIVGIVTVDGQQHAYLYVPPKWRGDEAERGTLHHGLVTEWTGQWAGHEDGLCCVTANTKVCEPERSR